MRELFTLWAGREGDWKSEEISVETSKSGVGAEKSWELVECFSLLLRLCLSRQGLKRGVLKGIFRVGDHVLFW